MYRFAFEITHYNVLHAIKHVAFASLHISLFSVQFDIVDRVLSSILVVHLQWITAECGWNLNHKYSHFRLTPDRSRKPTPICLRKNVDLLSISGLSNSPVGELGTIHGERSFLHNRAFASSSKKKSKADTSSLYTVGEAENDSTLPNIIASSGEYLKTLLICVRVFKKVGMVITDN